MKLMQGKLREDVYFRIKEINQIEKFKTRYLIENDTGYLEGKNGLHNIINESDNCAVSIHIYSPPGYIPKFYK